MMQVPTHRSAPAAFARRQRPFGVKRALRPALALALAAVLVALWGGPAAAHSGEQSYLYLDVTESDMSGRVEVPYADLEAVLDLDFGGDDADIAAELDTNRDRIGAYLGDHFAVGADGVDWPITFGDPVPFTSDLPEVDLNYAVVAFDIAPVGPVPRTFEVTFDPFVDEVDGRSHLLLIANDWQGGVIDNGYESLLTFDAGSRVQTADLGQASVFKNLMSSVKLGIQHIETGPDHILFVLALLLPSVLIWRAGQWMAVDSFGSALWRILKIVTMFTVAHSITFTLAGLDILPLPPSKIVEAIIALSIVAAAIHNLRPVATNREWMISFVFGLFHGMGFASLVSGLDVSRSTQLISLLGRNIGIELGQAVVVLVLFPLLFLLRRLVVYRPLFVVLSVVLAVLAAGWAIERSLEIEIGVDRLVDPVFVYPRIFIYVLVATVLAGLAFLQQRSNDRLLPTARTATVASTPDTEVEVPVVEEVGR